MNTIIFTLRNHVNEEIPYYLIDDLEIAINKRKINYLKNLRSRLKLKFDNLLNRKSSNSSKPNNWIINISDTNLTDSEKQVLNKGLNYALPNRSRDIPKFIANIESSIDKNYKISNTDKSLIRYQICSAIDSTPVASQNISKKELSAIKSLKNNKNIMIVPADKGCSIVVMNTDDYENKLLEHLSDTETYLPLQNNSTNDLKKRINSFLKDLFENKLLTREQYWHLFANSDTTPLFYALIKTHKPGYPIRPIVSFCGSPSYFLAQFLSNLLTPATNNTENKLINSYETKEKLKNIIIPSDHVLASFDVKSLFTSIPQDLALECCRKFISNNDEIFEKTRLNENEITDLINICLNATSFQYKNKMYQQIKGTPMGSPVSVVIAEIVMQHIEEIFLQQEQLPFWYHYVDDIITCIPQSRSEEILQFLNSINSSIQFTLELEKDLSLNFLDISLTRKQDNSLSFNVYRKPTHTNKYLDFESHHPMEHKNSVAKSLFHRGNNICDAQFKTSEFNAINQSLQLNGYPVNRINKIKRQTIKPRTDQNQTSNNNDIKFISAPYIKGVSERASRILRKHNIKLAHKPTNTLKTNLCKMKDARSSEEKAGVIYKMPCRDCEVCYIGETGRALRERLKEHEKDVIKKNIKSNVYHHVRDTDHLFDFKNTKLLDTEPQKYKRLHLESIYTLKNPTAINRSIETSEIYLPIIRTQQQ